MPQFFVVPQTQFHGIKSKVKKGLERKRKYFFMRATELKKERKKESCVKFGRWPTFKKYFFPTLSYAALHQPF